jgi:hypothetical protein
MSGITVTTSSPQETPFTFSIGTTSAWSLINDPGAAVARRAQPSERRTP